MILTGNIGFPTIGPYRELKTVVEGVWRGEKNSDEMIKETEKLLLMRTTLQEKKPLISFPAEISVFMTECWIWRYPLIASQKDLKM